MENSSPLPQTSRGFILRFDDVTPWMAWNKFLPLKAHLEQLSVPSVLGVVPLCKDRSLMSLQERRDFFSFVRQCASQGDTIAQHGTHHVYDSSDSGLLNIQNRSEFAGHPYHVQIKRLARGKDVLLKEGVWQPYFMAPSHSFDRTTLKALKALEFQALTDGYGISPYRLEQLILVPQLTARPIFPLAGIQTLCVHINGMNDHSIRRLMLFVERHHRRFLDFKAVASQPIRSDVSLRLIRFGSEALLRSLRYIRSLVQQ